MDKVMQDIQAFMEKPLSGPEIALALAVLVLFLLLVVWADQRRARAKAKKFPQSHPGAALVYLYQEGRPALRGRVSCSKGKASPPFPVPASRHPAGEKGLAFYLAPGPSAVTVLFYRGRGGDGAALASGQVSFQAEKNGEYRVQLQPGGRVAVSLQKGSRLELLEPEPETPRRSQEELPVRRPVSLDVVRDFRLREFLRLLVCCLFLLLPLGYLAAWGGLSPWILLFPPALFLVVFCKMMAAGTQGYRRVLEGLTPQRQERILRDFQQPHPIVRISSGEAHLLPDSLICRCNGRLTLIPLEEVVAVSDQHPRKTYGVVRSLTVQVASGRKYHLDFAGFRKRDLPLVLDWIRGKNGRVLEE